MKKYTTLPVDYTNLISELKPYIQNPNLLTLELIGIGHKDDSPAIWDDFVTQVPSINTTFSDLGLVPLAAGYRTVCENRRKNPNSFSISTLMIPVTDVESKLIFYQPSESAKIIPYYASAYLLADCSVIEEIPFTEPMLIGPEVTFNINTIDPNAIAYYVIFIFENSPICVTDVLLAE